MKHRDNPEKRNHQNGVIPLNKSLQFRLIVSTVLIAAFMGVIVLFSLNYIYRNRVTGKFIESGTAVARTVACMVNGEMIDKYLSVLEEDTEYRVILHHLRTMQIEHDLLYIYITRITPDGQIFLFDTDDEPIGLGEYYSWADSLGEGYDSYTQALYKGERVEPLIADTPWGKMLSVYEPIFRADGSVAGWAGVDISMDSIMREETSMLVISGLAVVFIILTIIAVNLYVSKKIVITPIGVLVKKSGSFLSDENTFPQDNMGIPDIQDFVPELRSGDELSVLEHTIVEMVRRINGEMNKRDLIQEALMHNEKMFIALNEAAVLLLSHNDRNFSDTMTKGAGIIADAVRFDRFSIWRNYTGADGLHASQIYRFNGETSEREAAFSEMDDISYNEFTPRFEEVLRLGETINGPVDLIPEVKILEYFGCVSIFIAPILIDNEFWGFSLFINSSQEIIFTEREADILRSASVMMAFSVNRYKETEKNREIYERIKLMLDATPLCCILWDENYNAIDCNDAAVKLFSQTDRDFLLNHFIQFSPENQPNGDVSVTALHRHLDEAFKNGSFIIEWTYCNLDGEQIPAEVTFVRIKYGDGFIIAGYTRDLREEKANHLKLLESMERERTLEIQKEAAHAASELKTQFLANMSHEIRTPMNAILGMSDLLLSEKLNKQQRRYAKDIKISATALLEIINDLLDISKIQSGKLSLFAVHYDLYMLMDNINTIIRQLAQNKNIGYIYNVRGEIPRFLFGDDMRIRQVLINVLNNAVKFTDSGHVSLTVSDGESGITFSVSDTGLGIKRDDMDMLFDAFAQVDMRKNRTKTGTGLGLSITKSLVEMMGGQIKVESEYGKGSTFNIIVPKVLGDETKIEEKGDDSPLIAPSANILVVDDNTINLNVARGLLKLCRIKADTADSGQQAVDMVREKNYDLVFMDHMMPGMDGAEATKIIRELGIKVPIIALTANAVVGMKEVFMEAGMDGLLIKPIEKAKFFKVLSEWIPAEKQIDLPEKETEEEEEDDDDTDGVEPAEVLDKANRIEAITLRVGLDRAAGRADIYVSLLESMINEIEKCENTLNNFLDSGDMHNFDILVHSMKSALANIGAEALSERALLLERAAEKEDWEYCSIHTQPFLADLESLNAAIKDALGIKNPEKYALPESAPDIFNKLKTAFNDMDFAGIDEGIEALEALQPAFPESEYARIKEAVMMMDYDSAARIMDALTRA